MSTTTTTATTDSSDPPPPPPPFYEPFLIPVIAIVKPWYQHFAQEAKYDRWYYIGWLLFEAFVSLLIIHFVAYTEIDWEAYMQEVGLVWDYGERDYYNIYGYTGPLVYPAGFVYLYGWLRRWTDFGRQIRKAQYFFAFLYVAHQAFVLLPYYDHIRLIRSKHQQEPKKEDDKKQPSQSQSQQQQDKPVEPWIHDIWSWRLAMALACLSKRMHSIFLLRLFNDGPTMLLLHMATTCFMQQWWSVGCVVFSLAVSMKMNVLLFAPGLLLLLLQVGPDLDTVIWHRLALCCALPQVILGAPFLFTYPIAYLHKAFELTHVFFYQWTVNWKVSIVFVC